MPTKTRSVGRILLCLFLATTLWLPTLHLLFRPKMSAFRAGNGIPPEARGLAERQIKLWAEPLSRKHEIDRMRASNAEWDFMSRTYLVLALANMSLREPAGQARYLQVADVIIDETLRLESEKGVRYFLMDYAKYGTFRSRGNRSLFEDGEIALMLGARCVVAERSDYHQALQARVGLMVQQMTDGPALSGESYPDECWMFCNAVAVDAMRMEDALDGNSAHGPFIKAWESAARTRLTDKKTGLVISSFRYSGEPLDGPEGSSIWMVSHCLQLIDPAWAQDQYDHAKKELGRTVLGFGYSREWPTTWQGQTDVDSGPVIPVLGISAGASGLSFVGAAAFGDDGYLRSLLTSLNFGGFPEHADGTLCYHASNQVGDSVLLYSLVLGPLWKAVEERRTP